MAIHKTALSQLPAWSASNNERPKKIRNTAKLAPNLIFFIQFQIDIER